MRLKRRKLTKTTLATVGGDALRPHAMERPDRIDYRVPANGRIIADLGMIRAQLPIGPGTVMLRSF